MICWHKYKHIGWVPAYYWLGGVAGGVKVSYHINAKQCEKCGKLKEVS